MHPWTVRTIGLCRICIIWISYCCLPDVSVSAYVYKFGKSSQQKWCTKSLVDFAFTPPCSNTGHNLQARHAHAIRYYHQQETDDSCPAHPFGGETILKDMNIVACKK